ncbi:hypothetical protein I551_6514 [Mycobacterium ulcerans str. Harvey]|uniref:Uncharacterized protein n=1 Tax=Mycobacterium ulcerans str. Harvey TaxID=1299332 RepID=A0ABP3A6I8_MYCUL|nr:hypothetical protein I551_6514 [Mycobacterium ulcerans str. Harvey]
MGRTRARHRAVRKPSPIRRRVSRILMTLVSVVALGMTGPDIGWLTAR